MDTRHRYPLATAAVLGLLALAAAPLRAGALDVLTGKDASGGLRAALGQGIDKAVAQLGAPDGFLANPKVTIPLPPALEKVSQGLRMLGMGDDADALKAAMNHAAEAAVGEARPVLRQALQRMSLKDAKDILAGGDDAGTQYFRRTTATTLAGRFKPIVARATGRLKLASQYDRYAGKAASFGLIKGEDANLDDYVTARALDGLFVMMADEERAIRKDPLGQASALIRKVFGAAR